MTDRRLAGRRILIVEDEYLVALTLTELVEDAGASVLGPIGWVEEALGFLDREAEAIDGAILDVNLHGEASYPIADALAARGIRFVFTTGYDAAAMQEEYRSYPRCEKPCSAESLFEALSQI